MSTYGSFIDTVPKGERGGGVTTQTREKDQRADTRARLRHPGLNVRTRITGTELEFLRRWSSERGAESDRTLSSLTTTTTITTTAVIISMTTK